MVDDFTIKKTLQNHWAMTTLLFSLIVIHNKIVSISIINIVTIYSSNSYIVTIYSYNVMLWQSKNELKVIVVSELSQFVDNFSSFSCQWGVLGSSLYGCIYI